MKGFELESSTRSSLGWEMIRLLKEIKTKPKYIIFENVAMIKSKKFVYTLDLFKRDLMDLDYTLYDDLLCAADYEIPQTRTRYFLVAILKNQVEFNFPQKIESNRILKDYLEESVDEKYYLTSDKYKKSGNKKIFTNKKRDDIEYEVDMNKYSNGGVCGIDKHTKFEISSRLFSIYGNSPTLAASNTANNVKIVVNNGHTTRIRKLTPKECWGLMGFDDMDFEKASCVCCETNLYKQAGNSIVVNVIYNVLKKLFTDSSFEMEIDDKKGE